MKAGKIKACIKYLMVEGAIYQDKKYYRPTARFWKPDTEKSNKITKIVTESDFVKKNFIFLHKLKQTTEYKKFMQNLLSFTVTGKAKHDDAPDAIAMLSQLFKELSRLTIKIIDRRSLPF